MLRSVGKIPLFHKLAVVLSIAIVFGIVYNFVVFPSSLTTYDPMRFADLTKCKWDAATDPVLFNLRTKLGVNYEASHWFHIAENFMVHHSILRAKNELANASEVFYNFDKENFLKDLNGFTMLMIYLGTVAVQNHNLKRLGFVHIGEEHLFASKARKGKLQPGDTFVLSNEAKLSAIRMKENELVDMATHIPVDERFTKYTGKYNGKSNPSMRRAPLDQTIHNSSQMLERQQDSRCVKYVGTIGGDWPTVQRGHWFPNSGDVESFRTKIQNACPKDNEKIVQHSKKKKFKMVVYQRDLSRTLANEKEAISYLNNLLNPADWDIEILMHSTKRSPCTLSHILHNADVLLTPHGFQSMLLFFLPIGSILFEVFPYRYYKRAYGPLGKEYGVVHGGVMSPATTWHTNLVLSIIPTSYCMESKYCRNYARNQDVILTEHGANTLVRLIDKNIMRPRMEGKAIERSINGSVSSIKFRQTISGDLSYSPILLYGRR